VEAKRLLDQAMAAVPEELRGPILQNRRVNREIMKA
jgi:hypothetical protein